MATGAVAEAPKDLSSGPTDKGEEIKDLLRKLSIDLNEYNLLPQQRTNLLEQLKVLSRDPKDADELYTQEAIHTLGRHSFDSNSLTISREALRCLANIFLLQAPTRQIFVDLGFGPKAAERLKQVDNRDDEFVVSRILFLMGYNTDLDFEKLVNENQLGDTINQNIARHSKRYSRTHRKPSQPDTMAEMALAETLKLLFNVSHFYPQISGVFVKSIAPLFKMLSWAKITSPVLQPPIKYILNALTNLDLEDKKSHQLGTSPLFPKFDQKCNAERLILILENAVADYEEEELDTAAAPLITLIRSVYELAPDNIKRYMESALLPSDEDRDKPLGRSDTLPSQLLRMSTSPALPTLRILISAMLFELSGKDATKFVQNVGYGFASGFLMSNGMSIPANAMEAFSDGERETLTGSSTNGTGSAGSVPINPITGQKLEAESKPEGPPMTDEEKEREAERLFVLFERLRANGIINVENPIRTAVESGRIEELPD